MPLPSLCVIPETAMGPGPNESAINPLIQGTLDSLSSNVAVLDGKGRILAVNAAWRQFGRVNGLACGAPVGANYLEACLASGGTNQDLARSAEEGIRSVLQGDQQRFDLEYPCHSFHPQRWFMLRVTRFNDSKVVCGLVAHEDITERKLAELKLFERNLLLDALIASSPLALVVLDAGHHIRMCNAAFEQLFGFTCAEATGRNLDDLIAPRGLQEEARQLTREGIAGNKVNITTRRQRKDGTLVDVELHAVPLVVQGALVGAYAFYKDITERVQAAEALRRAEERFSKAFHFSPDCMCINTLDGRFVEVNESFTRLTGYKSDEVLGRTAVEVGIWARAGQRDEWIAAIRHKGVAREFEAALRHKDGTVRQTLLTGSVVELDGVPCVLNVTRDVTEQRAAEEQQRRLAAILEATPDFVGMADAMGRVLYLNPAGRHMVGYSPADHLAGRLIAEIHPKWAAWLVEKEGIPSAIRDGMWRGETALLDRDGREIPVSQVIVAHRAADGALTGLSTVARDISERKQTEEALRSSEERFSRAFQSSPDPVTISTVRDGRYIEVNERFTEMTGYTHAETIGKTAMDLGLWPDDEQRAEIIRRLHRDGAVRDFEARIRIRSGEMRTGILSSERITVAGVECMLTVVRDITERRRLEDQLRQAQKMEAIGRLAGGVAHDFNNLLMVIKGYTELIADGFIAEDPHRAHADQVLRAADRAASLTRQLLAFSRKQVIQPKILNLNTVLHETEKMLRRLIGEDIELEVRAAKELGEVKADSGQMEQVLLNLAVNSRDAMPGGGRLVIETSNVVVDETLIPSEVTVRPGHYVLLRVTDTGCGMNAETQAHLFEPFFTTKEVGKGTGLGLATVYGVVRQAGGWIRVYSEVGHGSTFRIYLPRATAVAAPSAAAPAGMENLRGTETILLVEDDPNVRQLARDFLSRAGYTVLDAPNGADGLRIAGECRQPIHLLVSDVVMPKMSGRELAERLLEQRPAARVLFVSGYTDNIILPEEMRQAGFEFLSKPYRRDELMRKVRDILDRP